MSLIVYLILLAISGLFVGALARLALPGRDPMGIFATIGVGLAGSFLAGLVTWAIWGRNMGGIALSVFAGSRATRVGLVTAVVLAAVIWVVGENLGEIATGQATDPNTGPLLILLAAAYLPVRQRQEIDVQPHAVLRDLAEPRVVRLLRIRLGNLRQRRDVADHRGRQVPRHHVPVPLHEHKGDDRLQDDHRRHDDQQRAGIKPLRHDVLEPASQPVPRLGHASGGGAKRGEAEIKVGHDAIMSL